MLKKKVIESLDAGIGRIIGPLRDDPNILLVVTADHSTPSGGPSDPFRQSSTPYHGGQRCQKGQSMPV